MPKNPKQYRKDNIRAFLLYSAKGRAKKQGLPFNLVLEDITIPDFCPVLGIPLKIGDGHRSYNSPSLDKIIPSLGYVKGNVRVISWRANKIKADASIDELERVVAYVRAA